MRAHRVAIVAALLALFTLAIFVWPTNWLLRWSVSNRVAGIARWAMFWGVDPNYLPPGHINVVGIPSHREPLLTVAVKANDCASAEALIEYGAIVDLFADHPDAPIVLAAEANALDLGRTLYRQGRKRSSDSRQCTPLHHQLAGGRYDVAALLLAIGDPIEGLDSEKYTPLCRAVARVDVKAVDWLLSRGADPHVVCMTHIRRLGLLSIGDWLTAEIEWQSTNARGKSMPNVQKYHQIEHLVRVAADSVR